MDTVTIPREEYQELVQAKEELAKKRMDEYYARIDEKLTNGTLEVIRVR